MRVQVGPKNWRPPNVPRTFLRGWGALGLLIHVPAGFQIELFCAASPPAIGKVLIGGGLFLVLLLGDVSPVDSAGRLVHELTVERVGRIDGSGHCLLETCDERIISLHASLSAVDGL